MTRRPGPVTMDLDTMEIDCLIEELEHRQEEINTLRSKYSEMYSKRQKALKLDALYFAFGAILALSVVAGAGYLLYNALFKSEATERCYIVRERNAVEAFYVKRDESWAVDSILGFSPDFEEAKAIAQQQGCVLSYRKRVEANGKPQ